MITKNEAAERYNKMDWEGGFWDYWAHSGSSILDGTPFEIHADLLREADKIAQDFADWLEEHAGDQLD